ncbi:MAG: hypothetical protein AAB229_01010, partial [Candidatus Hydrogenedentota bacterium]
MSAGSGMNPIFHRRVASLMLALHLMSLAPPAAAFGISPAANLLAVASEILNGGVIGAAEKITITAGSVTFEMVGTKFVVTYTNLKGVATKGEVALDDISEVENGKRTHYGKRGLENALKTATNGATLINVLSYTPTKAVEDAMTKVLNPPAASEPKQLSVETFKIGLGGGGSLDLYTELSFLDASGKEVKIPASAPRDVTVTMVSGPKALSGPMTTKASTGSLGLNKTTFVKAGTYKLKFSSPGLKDAEATYIVPPGRANKLIVQTEPSGAVAGKAFTVQPVLHAVDENGDLVSSYVGLIKVEIASGNGKLTGTVEQSSPTRGATVSFSDLTIDKPGTYTLKFTDQFGNKFTATSKPFTVAEAAKPVPTKLAVSATTPASLTAGQDFSVTVTAQNASGKTVADYSGAVTLWLWQGTKNITLTGTGVANGAATVNAKNGVATFTGLKAPSAGNDFNFGARTVVGGKNVDAYGSKFNIAAAKSATQLQAYGIKGIHISSKGFPEVGFMDANGREIEVPASAPIEVTVTKVSGPGELQGATKIMASGKRAKFSDLTVTKAGKYRLKFTATGLKESEAPYEIWGPPATMAVSRISSGGIDEMAGSTFSVSIDFFDEGGHQVTSIKPAREVTVALVGGGTLKGTTKVEADFVSADFRDLVIEKTGTYSLKFTSPGLPDLTLGNIQIKGGVTKKLVIKTQPSGGEPGKAFTTQPVVEEYDVYGNIADFGTNRIDVAIASGNGKLNTTKKYWSDAENLAAIYDKNGVADFNALGLAIDKAGTYTLKFSMNERDDIPAVTSNSFTVAEAVPVATKINLATAPAGAVEGRAFATQPKIEIQDANGKIVTTSSVEVVARIKAVVGGATPPRFVGTSRVKAINGVATFTDLGLTLVGTHSISFGVENLPSVQTSVKVEALPAPAAAKLRFNGTPRTTFTAGVDMPDREFMVEIVAADGTLARRDADKIREITISSVAGDIGIKGTSMLKASGSQAGFHSVIINKAGTHTLRFSSPGLPNLDLEIKVTPGAASKLEIVTQPVGGDIGKAFATQPNVKITDAGGNLVASAEVTAAIASGDGRLVGTSKVASANGVATFSGLAIDKSGKFKLKFTSGTMTATSNEIEMKVPVPSANEIGSMTPEQFAKLPPEVFSKFTQAQTSSLKPEQIKAMTTAQFGVMKNNVNFALAFKPDQIAAFSPENLKNLQPIQLSRFSTTQLQALTKDQRAALTADQQKMLTDDQKKLLGLIKPVDPKAVTTAAQMKAITPAQLNKMSPEQFSNIAPDAFSSLSSGQIAAITPAQLKAMTNEQFAKLKDNPQFLTALIYFKADKIAAFKPDHIKLFSDALLKRLKPEQVKAFTPEQVAALSDAQKAALGSKASQLAKPPAAKASSLAVAAQPVGENAGVVLATQPKVEIRDQYGKALARGTSEITATVEVGPGKLSGTTKVKAANGVATFTNLALSEGGEYTLKFTGAGFSVFSASFNLAAPKPCATKLSFSGQATLSALAGEKLSASTIGFDLDDGKASDHSDDQAREVTVALAKGEATLKGTTKVNASSGKASFADLQIEKAGTYTLRFSSTGLAPIEKEITIHGNSAATIEIATQPVGDEAGKALKTQPKVKLTDAFGNVPGLKSAVTVEVASGDGTLSGASSVTTTQGDAFVTFGDLALDKAGKYTLKFTEGSHSVVSASFEVTAPLGNTVKPSISPAAVEIGDAL